jgi:hypothetical protein
MLRVPDGTEPRGDRRDTYEDACVTSVGTLSLLWTDGVRIAHFGRQ